MKRIALLIPLLALALSACETSRPYRGSYPPGEPSPPPPGPSAPPASAPSKPITVAPLGPLKPQNIAIYMDALEKDLRARLRGSTWLIMRRGDELFIGAQNAQLFDASGNVALPAEGWLGRLALSLRRHDRTRLEIGGFTDTTGANDKNIELSTRRAEKIADSLIGSGVKSTRVKAVGYGETRLRVQTQDEASEPRNRRIEIRITPMPG